MNKKYLRVGLLLLLLAIPTFFVLFLHLFGKNKFDLQIYSPYTADCGGSPEKTHTIPDFSLVSQDGKAFSLKDLEGKIYVTDFIFTRCPSICKDMSSQLLRVQEAFKDRDDIRILSHSVDPEHDTPEVLKAYAQDYGINTKFWTLLTGNKDVIYKQAQCAYFLPVQKGSNGEIDFVHSERLVLIDKEKRIRGYYDGTKRDEVDRLIMEIQILLQAYE